MRYRPHCYDPQTFLIYIDSYENGNLVGYYYHPYRDELRYFSSLMQFLEQVEECLDREEMPQAYRAMRSFVKKQSTWNTEEIEESFALAKMATFEIRIFFRRNSSWQGELIWLAEGCKQSFRSVLEMVFLMNSALIEMEMRPNTIAT